MFQFRDKQPYEVLPGRYIDFGELLLENEVIQSFTVECSIPELLEAGSAVASGTVVSWTIVGGEHDTFGIFTVKVVGSLGSKRQLDAGIHIIDAIEDFTTKYADFA